MSIEATIREYPTWASYFVMQISYQRFRVFKKGSLLGFDGDFREKEKFSHV